jgi:23S rRNA (cytidine1920-2'-O)/16S rRNA (cytidine1409-2'-O)-methyltransferase
LKERLDKVLVAKGLVKSRDMARALIMEGNVFVGGNRVTKAGTLVSATSDIVLRNADLPYVGRGGLKLEAALDYFHIDVKDKVFMDVGSSTGGFTDCLLQRGAKKVFCIDVGYGQLDWSLRNDPRVVVMERTNVRYLGEILKERMNKAGRVQYDELIERGIDMATADVSFISLKMVIPEIVKFVKNGGEILALIKPQFEVGRGEVGKGGIVKEEDKRLSAVRSLQEFSEKIGLATIGILESPVAGQKGNREYFLYVKR